MGYHNYLLSNPFEDSSYMYISDPEFGSLVRYTFDKILREKEDDSRLVLVAQRVMGEIASTYKRVQVSKEIEKRVGEYLDERYEDDEQDVSKRIKDELHSLIHYLKIIDDIVSGDKKIAEMYSKSPNKNEAKDAFLFHHYIQYPKYREEYLCYSQAIFDEIKKDIADRHDTHRLPIYYHLYENRIVAYPAYVFCMSLLQAEFVRRNATKVDKEAIQEVTVKEFPIKLRNYCFDEYIRIRAKEELKLLLEDNDRPFVPDEEDAKKELLWKEETIYNDMLEDEDVNLEALRMTKHFIDYLKADLGVGEEEDVDIKPTEEKGLNKIEKRIMAVYKSKLCKHKGDWGVVMKLMIEYGECSATSYKAVANRINRTCGEVVTTGSDLSQCHIFTGVTGTWKEGWKDHAKTRQSANLLLHFEDIARVFMK